MNQPQIKDAITTIEAAQILGCDPSNIRHLIRRGKIQTEKRGRDNYVSRQVIKTLRAKKNGNRKAGK